MSEWVYIFRRADGLRKVGWTTDIYRRVRELSLMTLVEHSFEWSWRLPDGCAWGIEAAVHRRLRAKRVDGHREVYRLPPSRLKSVVNSVLAAAGIDAPSGEDSPRPDGRRFWPAPDWPHLIASFDEHITSYPEEYDGLMAGFAEAAKRLGMKTPAGYKKRLARALENAAKGTPDARGTSAGAE